MNKQLKIKNPNLIFDVVVDFPKLTSSFNAAILSIED